MPFGLGRRLITLANPGTRLVVGLGNPGPTYAHTRHNVGFMVVDELARRAQANFTGARGMSADVAETRFGNGGWATPGGIKVILVKPRTFMNESGQAVGKLARFFKLAPDQIVVIHDELDLDLGRLRLKTGGGDNGHNGLKSIRSHLGSGDFSRVRLGIGRPPGRQPAADYVLARIPAAIAEDLQASVNLAADATEYLLDHPLAEAQNRFNH